MTLGILMNWIELIVGAVIGAILGEFVAKPIMGPILSNNITYYRKYIGKFIYPPLIPIHYISNSKFDSNKMPLQSTTKALSDLLNENGIVSTFEGNNIIVSNYLYGKTISDGAITFDYNEEELIDFIEIDLSSKCRFKKLPDDITGLSNAMSHMKEMINKSLSFPMDYTNYLMCSLNNLIEISGLLGGETVNYINLSGEINFDFSDNKVVLHKIIGPETIRILKKLIVLYY